MSEDWCRAALDTALAFMGFCANTQPKRERETCTGDHKSYSTLVIEWSCPVLMRNTLGFQTASVSCNREHHCCLLWPLTDCDVWVKTENVKSHTCVYVWRKGHVEIRKLIQPWRPVSSICSRNIRCQLYHTRYKQTVQWLHGPLLEYRLPHK